MSKNRKLPIVIGHLKDDVSDKCTIVSKDGNRVRVAICRLKEGLTLLCGESVRVEDIEGIISEIWFCRKQSLKAFIDALQSVYDKWEDNE